MCVCGRFVTCLSVWVVCEWVWVGGVCVYMYSSCSGSWIDDISNSGVEFYKCLIEFSKPEPAGGPSHSVFLC